MWAGEVTRQAVTTATGVPLPTWKIEPVTISRGVVDTVCALDFLEAHNVNPARCTRVPMGKDVAGSSPNWTESG
jgi:hypothetical protein